MFGIFWNQGEVCSATSRVLIEESVYEAVMERLIEGAKKIRIGHGLEDGVLLGPLVSESQHQKVLSAIAKAKDEGARVLTGGGVPEGLEQGCYVEPTILANAPLDGWAWNEEIFGPVVCVRPFSTEEEAIRWPMTAASVLARRSCPPISTGPSASPAPSAPESSGSIAASPRSPKRPGVAISNRVSAVSWENGG